MPEFAIDTKTSRALLLSMADAANQLGISPRKFRTMVDQGEIPTVYLDGRRLVAESDLRTFVNGLTRVWA